MRPVSSRLAEASTSSLSYRLIADVFYGADRIFKDLPVVGFGLTWDAEAEIKSSAKLDVVYTSEMAESVTPTEFTDKLAPFGVEVNLLMEVSVGSIFSETVLLGRYYHKAVPDARDEHAQAAGRVLTTGSVLSMTLVDNTVRLKRWGFHFEEQPVEGATCFGELQRITGFQLTRNVEDSPVPAGLLYEPKPGGRLAAVQKLAAQLGGKAVMTPDNTLTILPDAVSDVPVFKLVLGDRGTILEVGHSMDSEEVYNTVVGTFEQVEGTDRTPIYSVKQIEAGPLSVFGEYGETTYFYSAKGSYDQPTADAETIAVLSQVSAGNSYRVPFTALTDLRPQIGDVLSVERPTRTIIGRLMKLTVSDNGTMSGELDVRRPVPL